MPPRLIKEKITSKYYLIIIYFLFTEYWL